MGGVVVGEGITVGAGVGVGSDGSSHSSLSSSSLVELDLVLAESAFDEVRRAVGGEQLVGAVAAVDDVLAAGVDDPVVAVGADQARRRRRCP